MNREQCSCRSLYPSYFSIPSNQEELDRLANFLHQQILTALPDDIVKLIAGFCSEFSNSVTWEKHGKNAKVDEENPNKAILLSSSSASVLAGITFSEGVHAFCIHVDQADERGCRYIGVVNSNDVRLDQNLQNGASRHRCAWDGACQSIYYDIVNYSTVPVTTWQTGDSVQLEVDCNQKTISFFKNGKFATKIDVSNVKASEQNWTPVIGFGYTTGQSVTFCSYKKLQPGTHCKTE